MKTVRVNQLADRLGKHPSTVWRWVARGCDIDSENSIQQFLLGKKRRQNADPKPIREPTTESVETNSRLVDEPEPDLNLIELGPIGPKGAAAALARLEEIEERAHARLMRAIESGNQFHVKACQEFYLRSSETLRRLDLAVETKRRNAEEQVPQKTGRGCRSLCRGMVADSLLPSF